MILIQKIIPLFFSILSRISPQLAGRLAVELLFKTRRIKRGPKENQFWQKGLAITFQSGCKGRIFGSGERIICIVHGWHSQGSRFQILIDACLEQGMQVVVWDGPGHGDSPGRRTNLAAFARLLHADLHALGKKYDTILGHSFGAAATAYVCSLGLPVEKLIMISGPSNAEGVFERYWDWIKLQGKAQQAFINIVETEVKIKVNEMSARGFVRNLEQKILVVHDTSDLMVPFADSLELKSMREDIQLFQTEKLGHHRILIDQNVRSRIMDFLAGRPA